MARMNVAPTRSNVLKLQRQLAFAEEGYGLLEQKRQVLVFELNVRLREARELQARTAQALAAAFAVLLEAELHSGSWVLDRAGLGVRLDHQVDITEQRVLGVRLPRLAPRISPAALPVGLQETSARADEAAQAFIGVLALVARRAELECAVVRLARELRRIQRRCNALSRVFIPRHRETVAWILASLEERERESLVVLRLIRERLAGAGNGAWPPR